MPLTWGCVQPVHTHPWRRTGVAVAAGPAPSMDASGTRPPDAASHRVQIDQPSGLVRLDSVMSRRARLARTRSIGEEVAHELAGFKHALDRVADLFEKHTAHLGILALYLRDVPGQGLVFASAFVVNHA